MRSYRTLRSLRSPIFSISKGRCLDVEVLKSENFLPVAIVTSRALTTLCQLAMSMAA